MAFIAINLNDVKESVAAPKGSYELQITGAVNKVTGENSKHPGTAMIQFTLGFTDTDIQSSPFSHFMVFPYDGQVEYRNLTELGIKRFLVHFGIPFSEEGIDTEAVAFEAMGKVAVCNVDVTEPNADTGEVYNKLGYLPKLREEIQGGKGKAPRSRRGE